jgi:hypothetical protein
MTVNEKGEERVLGYWPKNLDTTNQTGWIGRGFKAYGEALGIGQRLHEQNRAVVEAKAANKPPPELPDATVRQQLARTDLKKLEQIKAQLALVENEVMTKQLSLKPFEYDNGVAAALNRQEIRAHMRGLDDTKRREAIRTYEYRAAALETLPELSGLSQTQYKAAVDETLQVRFPSEIAGITEARQALETAATALDTVRLAAENELKASGGQIQPGPPPKESEPWI